MPPKPVNTSSRRLTLYDQLRYNVVPPVFVVFFTVATQYLAWKGNEEPNFRLSRALGNEFSWKFVGLFFLWAFLSLKVPSKIYKGPVTSFGYTPLYSDNGFLYFWSTIVLSILILNLSPILALRIYYNFPEIIGSLNICAFILCLWLLYNGKYAPSSKEKLKKQPIIYEFYRGMEIHPRIFGVDVKQLTNCRIGLMLWEVLILVFFATNWLLHGFSLAAFATFFIQTAYLAKFYWWETGYFNTLDITLDRAGYYICWGCLVWVPAFYTYASYYIVAQFPSLSDTYSLLILVFGILSVTLNYWVDYERQRFRASEGQCLIWGKKASYIMAEYDGPKGRQQSKLLISGFWGVARHLNYVFEILAAFSWCAAGWGHGVWPFLYAVFLTVLLVHRVFRDEEKCADKYGPYWKKYCEKVPYRMIPYIF
ncbi:hypothetical protein QYM36_004233 [Artemia franciscana]|uniref:7-dehydrocholesterol reductase n=1 Tax=Artemia franciscana TaxID=6661 RepID=A0AA88L6H5_ARTSF|nr:hypothetical protein QYM36_004233 [Artemia franciscana]